MHVFHTTVPLQPQLESVNVTWSPHFPKDKTINECPETKEGVTLRGKTFSFFLKSLEISSEITQISQNNASH